MNNRPGNDPEFDDIITGGYGTPTQPEFVDPYPYGIPANSPAKTGLTPRGKAALAFGATVIAGGSLLGWQHYNTQQTASEARAQEFALLQQQIELEKLKEMNKANAAAEKSEKSENSERKKLVDDCVASNKKMVGKLMGVTYQSVRSDCETQYPATSTTGMQAAAATTSTDTGSDDGSDVGLLLGIAALVVIGGSATAKKFTKSSHA